jgi:hypothetical protein
MVMSTLLLHAVLARFNTQFVAMQRLLLQHLWHVLAVLRIDADTSREVPSIRCAACFRGCYKTLLAATKTAGYMWVLSTVPDMIDWCLWSMHALYRALLTHKQLFCSQDVSKLAARLKQELDSTKERAQQHVWMHQSPQETAQEIQSLRTRCYLLDHQLSELRRQLREERTLKHSVAWVTRPCMTRPPDCLSVYPHPHGVHFHL